MGSNDSDVLSDRCLTIQFNHQIDHENIQTQVQVHVWALCTACPPAATRAGVPGTSLQCRVCPGLQGCFGQAAAPHPASLGYPCTARISDCVCIKPAPATETLCFLDHHGKAHQICRGYPMSTRYVRRKKEKSHFPGLTEFLLQFWINKYGKELVWQTEPGVINPVMRRWVAKPSKSTFLLRQVKAAKASDSLLLFNGFCLANYCVMFS